MVQLKLSTEDLEFKKSREFPGKEPLINAAMALETTKAERTQSRILVSSIDGIKGTFNGTIVCIAFR